MLKVCTSSDVSIPTLHGPLGANNYPHHIPHSEPHETLAPCPLHVSLTLFELLCYFTTLSIAANEDIVINEIDAVGSGVSGGVCDGNPYIELKNIGSDSVEFPVGNSGFFDLNSTTGEQNGLFISIANLDPLEPSQIIVVCSTDTPTGVTQFEFIFDITPTDTITLIYPDRTTSSVTLLGLGTPSSTYQRKNDGTFQYAKPTPGQANVFQATAGETDVVINEIDAVGSGVSGGVCDGNPYIELKNIGSDSVEFAGGNSGFFDLNSTTGEQNGLFISFIANPGLLEPSQIIVVCSTDTPTGVTQFEFIFDITPTDTITLIYPDRTTSSVTLLGLGTPSSTYQRKNDGTFQYAKPTPGKANHSRVLDFS
jgi:hypothetical protein